METTTKQPKASEYISNPLEFFKPSWEIFRRNVKIIGLTLLAVMVFGVVFVGIFAAWLASYQSNPALGGQLLGVLIAFISIASFAALASIFLIPFGMNFLLLAAKGQRVGFKQIFQISRQTYWRVLGATFLSGIVIVIGFILLIIPGVIFTAWFILAPYVALNEHLSPVESLKRSRQLVDKHMTEMFGLLLLPTAISVVNLIPFVGVIVTIVLAFIYPFMTPLRYLQLHDLKASKREAPELNRWNYVVIVAAILLGGTYQSVQYRHIQEQQQQLQTTPNQTAILRR